MFECYEFEACEYNAQPKCCLPDGVECPHGVASHEPSDIEKLIEQLKEKDGLWCSIQTGEALIANTITALSTIQAENEKLRAELEQVQRERDAAVDCINQIQSARDHTRPAYVVDKILSDWRGPEEE